VYDPIFAMVFVAANVLIDVDHYLLVLYISKFKIWDLKRSYNFFLLKQDELYHIDAIFIFHTIEFLIIIFLIYWFTKYIYVLAVLFGLIYHILWDYLEVIYFKIKHKKYKFKQISIVWFLLKKYYFKKRQSTTK